MHCAVQQNKVTLNANKNGYEESDTNAQCWQIFLLRVKRTSGLVEPEHHSVVTRSLPEPHTASLEHTSLALLLLNLLQCSVKQFTNNIVMDQLYSFTHLAHRSFFQFCSCRSSGLRQRHARVWNASVSVKNTNQKHISFPLDYGLSP